MEYFSDAVVAFLHQQEFDYVVFNPGASFRGVHDSLVHPGNAGIAPPVLMCCHEEIAVAMAHGYHKASNRHMAVFVHANVGLLHAGMAIFNAWCDRVPLFVVGGNGPIDAHERRPWIDWIHTSQSIGSAVRNFVKWWDQPVGQFSSMESLYRARKLMETEAQAPVYVALDFETQEERLAEGLVLSPPKTAAPARLGPADPDSIAMLATRIATARMPVMIVEMTGRNPEAAAIIGALADKTGMAIVDRGGRFNLSSSHPLNLTGVDPKVFEDCDLIFVVETQDPAGAMEKVLPPSVFAGENPYVATLGVNDLLTSVWAADYQKLPSVDLQLLGDPCATLKRLSMEISGATTLPDPLAAERQGRVERMTATKDTTRSGWEDTAKADAADETALPSVGAAVLRIRDVLAGHDCVLANTGSLTIDGWVRKLWPLEKPGCYLGLNGGGGLGYGLGASIGAALAYRESDRLTIDFQADGDFLYTPSALWTAAAYEVPLLILVMNNRLYLNSEQHAATIARNRGRDTSRSGIATSFFGMPVDFTGLASSFGIHVEPRAKTCEAIATTVASAAAYVRKTGKPALVEIMTR